MEVGTAVLILTWVSICILALAVAGSLRMIRNIEREISESTTPPRRIEPGDRVMLPPVLVSSEHRSHTLVLFLKAGCRSCSSALQSIEASNAWRSENLSVAVVWAAGADGYLPGALSIENGSEVFERLHVGLTPFAMVLDSSNKVSLRSGLGSKDSLSQFLSHLNQEVPTVDLTDTRSKEQTHHVN